uniref:Fibrinogen like 2 n=1 Tax=Tetraodon nigroviridis TaxID=99883 RepID=H3D3J5_TETNG
RCPYLFNVPPLTIHLPKQLRELERMVQELQVLKDNVDELRRMCADCTREGQDKWATNPGGKKREGETNDRKNDRNGMENSRGDRDLLENGEGSVISGDLKKQEKTDDRTDPPVSPDRTKETKIKTQTQSSTSRQRNQPVNVITVVMRDCSDYLLRGQTKSRVYLVTPDLRSKSFPVFCDMELSGGGWTLLQRRQDGSVSFNRSWDQYRSGFGELDGGEFWLGNNRIHLLTRERDMTLRVELEDFDGGKGFAEYSQFRVASERLRYTLTVGGYSGNAGNALRFSKSYDHHHRAFTTPDRDHDRYPSGNCGAYYSSGWWFDACMAANLNGRYYTGRYKGVRDGIYWGTWHNISSEYYPTNDRQSFKSVRMMIRPKGFVS